MTTFQPSVPFGSSRRASSPLRLLADEAYELMSALLNPSRIIGEVERMHALQREASALEGVDAEAAAALRRRAARICLR